MVKSTKRIFTYNKAQIKKKILNKLIRFKSYCFVRKRNNLQIQNHFSAKHVLLGQVFIALLLYSKISLIFTSFLLSSNFLFSFINFMQHKLKRKSKKHCYNLGPPHSTLHACFLLRGGFP